MQSSIVEKLLAVLSIVSAASKPYTFSELVTASGLNKSTMHRLLALAIENNLLQFDEQRKAYLLGPKLFDLVRNAYHGYDIQIIALSEMMRLHKIVEENVTLGVPIGSDIVYLRILEAQKSLGTIPQPGMREPFHCSASGKAIMAFLPDSVLKAKLENYKFKKFTSQTITSADAFLAVLEETREVGYARNDREEYDHFVGISAPIFNYMSEPIAVLNIWSLHQQNSIEQLSTWAKELMKSAASVSQLIGGSAPSAEHLKSR